MANFIEELWNSIFVPGPTPTLLIATNVAFGTLLLLLLSLLAATRSIHFLILSFLSTGLWGAINWFAREVNLAHAQEESLLKKDGKPPRSRHNGASDMSADAMDSGDDTETEMDDAHRQREVTPQVESYTPRSGAEAHNGRGIAVTDTDVTRERTDATSGSMIRNNDRELRKRQRQDLLASTGSLSTDSEWEKVDDD